MGFKMIYWTPLSGSYFLWGSILEKKWKILEKRPFFRPDWGNITRADMAGLGSIGLKRGFYQPDPINICRCKLDYRVLE